MLVPKLRFKEFKDEWKIYKFYDVVSIINGQVNPNDELYKNLPHIGPGNIEKGTGRLLEYNLAKDDNLISSKYLFDENSIIYGKINPHFAKVCYPNFIGLCSADAYPITPNNLLLTSEFLLCMLLTSKFTKFATSVSMRTGMPKINRDELGTYKFTIPSIQEQEKIGKLISLLDKKINMQYKKVETLRIYKIGIINKLLNSEESLNWQSIKLNNILLPGSKEKVLDTSKYQKINIKLNLNGLIKNTSSREMADTRPFYVRNLDEIIIGKQNYFNGSIAIITKEFAGCICSNAIMSFMVKNDNPKYIYYYISQPNYIKKRSFLANGTGQKELSEKEFLNFEIKLPNIKIQNKIVETIDSIESKINIEDLKYEHLKLIKKVLLQQMFI